MVQICLQRTINMYHAQGFLVTMILADNEFSCTRDDLHPSTLNMAARNEHLPEVEHSVRTVKKIIRCTSNGLPYKLIPKLMVNSMVTWINTNINDVLDENEISDYIRPSTLVISRPRQHNKHKVWNLRSSQRGARPPQHQPAKDHWRHYTLPIRK